LEVEPSENAALVQLLTTITDRRTRRKVHKLLQHGEEAVRALGELDATLLGDGEDHLQIVADAVLSHFRLLLQYISMVLPTLASGSVDGEAELDLEGAAIRTPEPVSARSMMASRDRSDEDRWNALAVELSTLQYGLASELKEFERRFAHALENANGDQAVRDLNEATTRLTDGVFAVMTTVYECFLGYAEPERMVPGHRDTLGKALAVRRALAELRRGVHRHNRSVQDRAAPAAVAEANYRRIVDLTNGFVESDVFAYLRSDTRRDFWQFQEALAAGNAVQDRLGVEGYDKYLDTLSFISQRGVLLKHDSDLRTKIAGDLVRALKFATVLPDVVCEVIEQAFVKAERLSGLNDEIDQIVQRWSALPAHDRADLDQAIDLGRRLLDIVSASR
jgi:hypothetical protein